MAKKANPSITYNGTTYDADDCIQNCSFTADADDLTYLCNNYTKHESGNINAAISFRLALDRTDVTKWSALQPQDGTAGTGSGEYHPGGDVAGNIEITFTKASVISFNSDDSPSSIIMADVVIALDDYTVGTAV